MHFFFLNIFFYFSRSFSTPIKLSTDGFNNRYDSLPKLCNTSSSLLTNFDCSLSLIDGAKKLEIQSSNPELNISFKNNNLRLSPLASSSNILKPDPAVADQKWQCLVFLIFQCCLLVFSYYFFFIDLHLRELSKKCKMYNVCYEKGTNQQ